MPNTKDSLRVRIEAGERDFEGEDLDDFCHDLRELNLQGINFNGAFLVGNFHRADLRGATFIHANVKTCDFSHADLRKSNFSDAAIDGAVFTAAQLEDATFLGASEQGHVYALGELPWSK